MSDNEIPLAKQLAVKELKLFTAKEKAANSTFAAKENLFSEKRSLAKKGGGERAVRVYHGSGKKTARERIQSCVDGGAFYEIDQFVGKTILGDGVVTGWGFVKGRKTFFVSWDFTIIAGTCGHDNASKVVKIQEMALKEKCPLVVLNDSGGARIQEGMLSLAAYSRIFYGNSSKLSGRVPQVSLIMGNCAGGAVYSPAMTDLIIMTEKSFMAITGPVVLKAATGVDVKASELGGAHIQEEHAGVVHLVAKDDDDALRMAQKFLSFLPQSHREKPLVKDTADCSERETKVTYELLKEVGENAFDMRVVIKDVVDDGYYFEIQKNFAPNVSVGFARVAGVPIGIIANNSRYKAGCLDIDSSCKAAKFVNLCNLFNVPIVNFVDVPGFLAALEQERGGIIRHGAKLLFAQCIATVPKISLIIRKSFGGAYCVMLSKDIHTDRVYALPNATLAVMGAEGAVDVIHRKMLAGIEDKDERQKKRQELIDQYNEEHLNPWEAAQYGKVDDVIEAKNLRRVVARELPQLFRSYEPPVADRKYPNIPL
ncbi:acyl-CoA carboxylase subunit beta [Candidatus Uabimicrobium amorphum]|uniref:Propionyl-CoA carboxylase subunit alpha n=1 Tax=Uabimicrobium amorphum TaxID=2596890 RepID=A0A5S9F2J0_UABAM|nr:acyl-CoA carboxylase subunit beta [Candidatus Uabimicrobium amorphum]BBM83498.1 propionyl-CoA carboxylase subunit alpha [Candidatus Uabimicrobium amorphum]